jgi:hypothetical protein
MHDLPLLNFFFIQSFFWTTSATIKTENLFQFVPKTALQGFSGNFFAFYLLASSPGKSGRCEIK